jgi:hypothetical protein
MSDDRTQSGSRRSDAKTSNTQTFKLLNNCALDQVFPVLCANIRHHRGSFRCTFLSQRLNIESGWQWQRQRQGEAAACPARATHAPRPKYTLKSYQARSTSSAGARRPAIWDGGTSRNNPCARARAAGGGGVTTVLHAVHGVADDGEEGQEHHHRRRVHGHRLQRHHRDAN